MIKARFHAPSQKHETALVKSRKRFLTIEEIHSKYYVTIPYSIFCDIVRADPTYDPDKPDKMGKYGKWLLLLYQKKVLLTEDLYKAHDYLDCFDRFHRRFVNRSDINQIKSIQDLYDIIKDYLDLSEVDICGNINEERRIKDSEARRLYEDKDWIVIQPLTQQAAIIYGRGTQWCTSATRSHNYFAQYNSQGPLHILVSRKNNRKYQLHLQSRTYCDETDRSILHPIAESIGMSVGVARFYQKLGWYDLFRINQFGFDFAWNHFVKLDDRYYYFSRFGIAIDNDGVDNVKRYRWGNTALYLIKKSNKKNLIWASSEKPIFEEWYEEFQFLDRGIVIMTNSGYSRVYSLCVEMFFEDFLKLNCCSFKTICKTFASFTPNDRCLNLTPIARLVYTQAQEPEDYVEYLKIFGTSALYRKRARYKVAVPIIQFVFLIIVVLGAICAAIGFSVGAALGIIGACAFAVGFVMFCLVTFLQNIVINLIKCSVFLTVNGSLLYVLAEYGELAFILSIFGLIMLLVCYLRIKANNKPKSLKVAPDTNRE